MAWVETIELAAGGFGPARRISESLPVAVVLAAEIAVGVNSSRQEHDDNGATCRDSKSEKAQITGQGCG